MRPHLVSILALAASIAIAGCGGGMTRTEAPSVDTGHGPRDGSPSATSAQPSAVSGPSAVFPLALSVDRRNLVDVSGRPFLVQGDSAWSLAAELSKEDTIRYLDDRERLGFNAILFNVIEAAFTDHTPRWANAEGEVPFGDMNDWTTANEAYFAHVDWLLRELETRGMLALVVPAYIGYDCGAQGWCERMYANGVDRLGLYGRFFGARYRDYPNIVWIEGGDLTPSTTGDPSQMDLVNAVANGIAAGDGGAHYHAAHWGGGTSGADLPGLTWLDLDTTYATLKSPVYQQVLDDYHRDAGVMPVFLVESSYENENGTSMRRLRSQMYQPMLSGGCGFLFGNFPMWSFWDPGAPDWPNDGKFPGGWATALGSPGADAARIAGAFFGSLPWQDLHPDTDHAIVTAGFGTYGDEAYALAASTPDRRTVVVYFTGALAATIDMSQVPGPVRARFFDPALGVYSEVNGSTLTNAGSLEIAPPGLNGDGSDDWLLVLEAQ